LAGQETLLQENGGVRGFAGILCLLLLLCLSATVRAQPETIDESAPLEEQLESLEAALEYLYDHHKRTDGVVDADHNARVYRRADRGLAVLRDLTRLTREVAKLPEDHPQRRSLVRRFSKELTGVIDIIFAGAEVLDQHIDRISAELESGDAVSPAAQSANLYSLRQLRIDVYLSLGGVIEAQKVLGLSVDGEIDRLGDKLFAFAESLAGRLEYSGAVLAGLRANLSANPENTELRDAERSFAGRHSQDLERLSSISKLLGRLGLDNDQYKALQIKHGQTVSVSNLDSDFLRQELRELWEGIREAATDEAPDVLFRIVFFLLLLLVFFYLSRLARRAMVLACERSGDNMSTLLKDMLASISGALVMGVGFLMALSQVGISLAPMLAGLGVAGFIVGFALQDTLGNFAAGGMILVYRPYDVGDVVEVAGVFGVVKKMSLVSTTIHTFDNQTLVVPNSKIWGDVIKNVTAQKVRRVDLGFGIGYGDDIEKAEAILHDIVKEHKLTLSSPEPIIKLHTLGDSAVNFVVRPWVRTADYWDVYWDITREVKMRFDREGVSIPFPQRDVHIYREDA
jgi:small conductance mechanosensitive channel